MCYLYGPVRNDFDAGKSIPMAQVMYILKIFYKWLSGTSRSPSDLVSVEASVEVFKSLLATK